MYLYMHHLRIPEAKVVRVHHYHMYYTITKRPFVFFMLMSMFIAHHILFYSIHTGREKKKIIILNCIAILVWRWFLVKSESSIGSNNPLLAPRISAHLFKANCTHNVWVWCWLFFVRATFIPLFELCVVHKKWINVEYFVAWNYKSRKICTDEMASRTYKWVCHFIALHWIAFSLNAK